MKGFGRIYKRKGSRFWWIAYSVRGKEYRESSKSLIKEDAKNRLRERLEYFRVLPQSDISRKRLSDVLTAYVNDAGFRGAKTLVLSRSAKLISDVFGHLWAEDVSTAVIRDLQQELVKQHEFEPSTVNRITGTLRAAMRFATRNDWIRTAPLMPPRLKEKGPRQGFLEYADFVAIHEELAPWARDIFAFAYYTGWRKMEILGLRWTEVDLPNGTIHLDPARSKTGKGRVIPITGSLSEVIARRRQARAPGLEFVFHHKGRRIEPTTFDRHFRQAKTIAGREGFYLHDCRRSAVRDLVRAGVPERVAMQFTGHESRSILDRYHIVDSRDMVDAQGKLEEYRAGKDRGRLLPFVREQ